MKGRGPAGRSRWETGPERDVGCQVKRTGGRWGGMGWE